MSWIVRRTSERASHINRYSIGADGSFEPSAFKISKIYGGALESFYSTVATFCFTLIGLWWAVTQFRHDEWMDDLNHRQLAYGVYLMFLVPGLMSLGSQIDSNQIWVWQLVFQITSLFGIITTVFLIRTTSVDLKYAWFIRRARPVVVLLYALMFLIAWFPLSIGQMGIPLKGIQVEAVLLVLLLFLGVTFAWELLTEPKQAK